jgi:preprotein translocase subunit SecB
MGSPDLSTSQQQPGIVIAEILLERVSFEHRSDFLMLPKTTPPNVGDVTVQAEFGLREDGEGGVTRVTVSTVAANEPVYNFVVAMTALFVRQPDGMALETFLRNNSVALVYPFLREVVANVTLRGRFGPVFLNPFNTTAGWSSGPAPSQPPQPPDQAAE